MGWYKVELTEAEQAIVIEDRISHPNLNIRERMLVIWLLHKGLKRQQTAEIAKVSLITVQRVVAAFREGRLDALRAWNVKGPVSEMDSYRDIIRKSLEECPARTIAEAADRITELTGLKRQPTQVRKFLINLGFSWKRARAVPLPPKKTWQSTPGTRENFSIAN